ncbi:MAG TPA: hypothetical protein VGB68_01720 [Pyrinomonadaceae bacterium]|jgi:hypothetical protein
MKKIAFTLFLAFVFVFSLSINAFAEGNIPNGGRNCGYEGVPPCLVAPIEPTEDTTYYKTVIDYLAQLFG